MTQKQRSLALLGGVFAFAVALGLYGWFGVFQAQKAKDEAKNASDTLFTFKKEQVKKLTVQSHGQSVEATASDSGWEIQAPLKVRADKLAFDQIVDKLAGLKQKRDIGEQSGLSEYGLDAPKVKVAATLEDGSTHELSIGKDNSYDGTVFAKTSDSPRVSILEASVKFPLDKGFFELRDKRVLVFEDAQVKHLDVAIPGFAYGLDRSADGKWKLTVPAAMDADGQKAAQILNALKNLRATRFASDQASQPDLIRYGLDKPQVTVQLQLDLPDKKDTQATLTFSQVKEGTADHTYVKSAEQPFIAEVAGQVIKDLTVTLGDLRDKTVLSFDANAVKAFKFEAGAERFEARRSGGDDAGPEAWTLMPGAGAPPVPAKKWKLSALASTLHDLKGTAILSEQADAKVLAAHELEKPSKIITILGEGDAVLGKLLVGKTDGTKVAVKADGSPRVFQVDAFKVASAPSNAADLAETPPPAPASDAGADGGAPTAAK